ncbi:MAG: hypothetical protein ACRYFS_24810 [Janthinobacterium lividum]
MTVNDDRRGTRRSLFDYMDAVEEDATENKYCAKMTMHNEAGVEQFFVYPLLKDLGYKDNEIRVKESLTEIVVSRGRKGEAYKPDYALVCEDMPRWVLDAKSPEEDVSKWSYQGAGYALGLNKEFPPEQNPCQYFVITNGLAFNVYAWDSKKPVITLTFAEFIDDNPNFLALKSLLNAKSARTGWSSKEKAKTTTTILKKPRVEEVKRVFKQCHDLIWKTEHLNPQPAFFEFVKVMFVKLWEDRKLHEDAVIGPLLRAGQPIPKDRIVFSSEWVENTQKSTGIDNPIDKVLFEKLAETLKEGVARGHKKPIFDDDERIRLEPVMHFFRTAGSYYGYCLSAYLLSRTRITRVAGRNTLNSAAPGANQTKQAYKVHNRL